MVKSQHVTLRHGGEVEEEVEMRAAVNRTVKQPKRMSLTTGLIRFLLCQVAHTS